jgi:hypothetical protein
MELKIYAFSDEQINNLHAIEEDKACSILETMGREAAKTSGLAAVTEKIRAEAKDKDNEYLLFGFTKKGTRYSWNITPADVRLLSVIN